MSTITSYGTQRETVMAGLADEIRNEPSRRRRRNRIQEVMDQLDAKDKQALKDALDDENISAVSICRVMKARGLPLSESIISNYRRGMYDPL
jgi:hypothetical protein